MLKKNWLIIPLLIIGFYYNFWSIKNADNEMIFDGLIYGFLIIIFLIFLGFAINKDIKKYKNYKKWESFIPSIFGFIILISFFITGITLNMRDNSPIIIQAGYDGGYNGAWFEFRKDGTYKFVNHAGIGADHFRGKYELKDSIITLDKNEIDKVINTNKLAIRNENYGDSTLRIIYQINDNHKVIDKEIKFQVNEYNVVD
ncbi:hypothetical protein SAMN05660477_03136 [Soonwooa buanensis]|uniref:Uncharacterized protein n=1 Tax=Soonwooa buanensis TaxID=619805 RepID=A0A1T5GU32_9FLAO|nr:hypothetical protein [Soonwooa buanensis]SKC11888.1 hypothetical protein SAMN05660477_03136 [Soonwooa buanensis]